MEACCDASVTTPVLRLRRGMGGQSGENASPQRHSAQATTSAAQYPSTTACFAGHDGDEAEVAKEESPQTIGSPLPRRGLRNPARDGTVSEKPPSAGPELAPHAGQHSPRVAAVQLLADGLTLASLKERIVAMFLRGESAPRASRLDPAAIEATFGLIIDVNTAVREMWGAHADTIKRRCAPSMPKGLLAMQEVFGYVLADVLGRPLVPADKAMSVGQNGDNALRTLNGTKSRKGLLPAVREASAEAVRKAKRAAAANPSLVPRVAAAEAAGKASIAAVLARPAPLDLPNETVGKRKRVAPAVDCGAGTSAMSAEQTSEPRELPSVQLKAAMRAAEATVEGAAATDAADTRRHERARRALQNAQADLDAVSRTSSRWEELLELRDLRSDAADDALDRMLESSQALVEACHDARAAWYELQLALMRERAERAESQLRSEQALSDQLLELHGGWRHMQETQTEEQPTGQVVWGRAERWEPGDEDPWVVDEGEEGEEDSVAVAGDDEAWEWWAPPQRLALRGVDMPWAAAELCEESWDEETAACAAEEMRLTSAARCRADGLSAGSCSEGA